MSEPKYDRWTEGAIARHEYVATKIGDALSDLEHLVGDRKSGYGDVVDALVDALAALDAHAAEIKAAATPDEPAESGTLPADEGEPAELPLAGAG